jgi:hypothetical protein
MSSTRNVNVIILLMSPVIFYLNFKKITSRTPNIDDKTLYKKIIDCENDLKTLNCLSRKATMYINQVIFNLFNYIFNT